MIGNIPNFVKIEILTDLPAYPACHREAGFQKFLEPGFERT